MKIGIIVLILLLLVIGIYIFTYPFNSKFERKLKRVLGFKEVEEIEKTEVKYKKYSEQDMAKELVLEEKFMTSSYVEEKMRYLVLKPKKLSKNTKCIVLLHGIRDCAEDWLYKAKLRENYLTLREEKKIGDIVFIIPDSGYSGRSWYTNFYKNKKCQYEEFFSKDLTAKLKEEYPDSIKGIAGFSMGGYGALKIGLKNLEYFDVVASFSGAISLIRMSINRRVMRVFKYLYVPKALFNDMDKSHFVKVFSPWGYKILKNDPYSMIKKIEKSKYKNKKFYLSVGSEDKKPYLMFQQWLDVIGRAKRYELDFQGKIYDEEYHTWEYISRDLYNFLDYFDKVKKEEK